MRYDIMKDGKVVMTVPTIEEAYKLLELFGYGYEIMPITKSDHRRRFNTRR